MADPSSDAAAHSRQGKAWTTAEDRQLYDAFLKGLSVDSLASVHERSAGGIRARLGRLGLIDENGEVVEPPPPFAAVSRHRPATAAAPTSPTNDDKARSVFAVRTEDGWSIEIKSNRPLSRPLIERLASMLRRVGSEGDPP